MGNEPMSLLKSPVLVHSVHHFQYEGGQIQRTGSSDCAGHSHKLNLVSVTKEIQLGHIPRCP